MTSTTDTNADASGMMMINPESVNLSDTSNPYLQQQVTCFLNAGVNEYNGQLGARISSIFVILFVSSLFTFFPVVAARVSWLRINIYVYLFARYFGAGVIVATAFIHLLDPAYDEIGPAICVGLTPGWDQYSWVPAICLTSIMFIFILDLTAERYVEYKYGLTHGDVNIEEIVAGEGNPDHTAPGRRHSDHMNLHAADQRDNYDELVDAAQAQSQSQVSSKSFRKASRAQHQMSEPGDEKGAMISEAQEAAEKEAQALAFRTQIAGFLILEFGVIFHSVIIGLNLGTAGDEFSTLYVVLVFHQSFEGLGIGARMSAIPFPHSWRHLPWFLCTGYGLTTPIAIAIGLGLKTTYNSGSTTANIVSGVLDSISAGILIWTGLVELLARDFLFDPQRTKDNKRLAFMVGSVLLGAGIMALLGKWA